MKTILTLLVLGPLLISLQGEDRLDAARSYLDHHRVFQQAFVPPADYKALHAEIAASRDPETKFGPYIWALANPESKVLTTEQQEQLKGLIASRAASPVNWHDVRNIVRVQSLLTMWDYAAATDPVRVAKLDQEWRVWNELRLAYMFEEFVAKDRFQRAAWAVLNPKQRQTLVAGGYDSLIKKNIGHRRAFSAHKQVLKALGKPRDQTAFDKVVTTWERKWETVLRRNEAAAKFDRQRELAMDLADETFAVAAAKEGEQAFGAFTQSERDAVRGLVQAGYARVPDLNQKIAQFRDGLRAKMIESYHDHGAELLRRMGEF